MSAHTKGILTFLSITFIGTWSIWGIAWYLGMFNTSLSGQVLVAIGAFAPALASVIVRQWVTREGFADAGLRLHLMRKLPYYLVAWLLPVVGAGVIVGVATALGIMPIKSALPPSLVVTALVGALITTPLFWGEEFGWRGYLQLRMASKRPLVAAVATGLIWGVYHYPVILAGFEGFENALLGLLVFPVTTILLSIIFGWLRAKSGSIWVTCLAHSATNGIGGSLVAYLYLGGGSFLLTSYVGILSWVPLGIVSMALILAGQFKPSTSPTTTEPTSSDRHAVTALHA